MTRTDENLDSLRGDPRFAELTGQVAAQGMDRDDGWRADLRLLVREARRHTPFGTTKAFDEGVDHLTAAVPDLTDTQIMVELAKLVALLGDGHAFVRPPDDRVALLPVQLWLFDEGLFVIAAAAEHAHLLGTRVVAFDDHTTDDVFAALAPLISRDNDQGLKARAPGLSRQPPILHALGLATSPDEVTLTVEPASGKRFQALVGAEVGGGWPDDGLRLRPGWQFLPDRVPGPLPLYLRNRSAAYWWEHLPDQRLVYFQFNSVRDDVDEPLAAFVTRLFTFIDQHDVDRLVLDLRWNGGGNTFLVKPLVHALIGCRKINRRGGLFAIIGRDTFSAAQNTCTFIEEHTDVIFVGEPTGSRPNFIGETVPFTLPNSGLRVNVSDLYWQTSWPLDRRCWIPPDLYAPPTFEAFAANRDPALEGILGCNEHLPGW